MGKILLIASGKGGVGKTTLAVNVGMAFAQKGKSVIIADMNVGMRNDDIYLGLEDRILFDFGDVCSGVCKLEKAIVRHDEYPNLSLLSCPQNRGIDGLTTGHARALYAKLRKEYDYVIVDMPTIKCDSFPYLATGADESVLVVNQDYVSMRNGEGINSRIAGMGVSKRWYIVNMLFDQSFSRDGLPSLDTIDKNIDAQCLGYIPFDFAINLANNTGTPIVLDERMQSAKSLTDIALRLL